MKPPEKMSRIVDGKRYRVETATLLASDCYWDGHSWERLGCNTFLYRTPRGNYFTVVCTQGQEQQDCLMPISEAEAIDLFQENLREHYVDFEVAFRGVVVDDA